MFKYRNKALGWVVMVLAGLWALTTFPAVERGLDTQNIWFLVYALFVAFASSGVFVVGRELTGAYDIG
jgi:hypothetical protein